MGPEKGRPKFGQQGRPQGKFGGGGGRGGRGGGGRGGSRKRPAEIYQNKKQLELQMRKEKREIGIKGRYKKLLRKEQKPEGPRFVQDNNSDERVPNLGLLEQQQAAAQSSQSIKPEESDTKERKWRKDKKNLKTRGPHGKPTALKKAKNLFEQKRQDREWKESEKKRQDEERKEAIINRKKKRLEKFKVLNQKTPKGQPLMKGRIQMLLQKIQSGMT